MLQARLTQCDENQQFISIPCGFLQKVVFCIKHYKSAL